MNTVADLYLGQVSDQGQDLALTKTGAAALVFDETTLASTMDNTTIDVQDGTLGVVGGSNPIGGATIKITDDDVVVVLSGKTGDYSLDNAFDIDASGTLEAHTGWSGVGEDVTVTLNNATATGFDIAAGETLTVNTADGYVLNLDNTVSGGGTFLLADGNVTVANAGVFSAGTPVEVGPDGFLQFTVPATVQPPLTVRGGGALGGDLTGFNYGAGTLTLEDGAIIVQGPGGTHPTWATYGACNLYMSVIDVAGTYDGIGCNDGGGDISSDGPAWEGTYKGVVFDDRFTAAGNFTGTINESEQSPGGDPYASHGFEIALHRDQMFGDNADHVTPLNAPTLNTAGGADHAVTITNDAGMARKWTIGAPLAGTADVYNRVGNDTSEIGYETIELEWVADLVPSGKTVNVQYGTLFMDKNNAMRDAVNDGAAMTFQDAGLVLNDNLQTGQWTIKDGGYVWSNNASRMTSFTGTGSVTFENGSYWHYNYDQPKWELDGLPTDGTGVNIIADEDFFGTDDDNKLMLGQNAMLTTPHAHGGISLNDRSGSTGITTGDPWAPDPSGGIVLQKKDGTITDVQIGRSGSGDLAIEMTLDLSNDSTDPDSRANLVVGAAPGAEPLLPPNSPAGNGSIIDRDWNGFDTVPMTGTIRIRSGRAWNNNNRSDGARIGNWGKGTLIAGNIDVKSCELAIGDGWQQRGLIDVDINGDVTVRDGGRVYVSDWSLDADKLGFNPWEDGTLGNTWFIENGGQVDMYVWNTKNGEVPDDVVNVATKFEFVGGPADPANYTWRIDHHEQGGWNNQNSLNVT